MKEKDGDRESKKMNVRKRDNEAFLVLKCANVAHSLFIDYHNERKRITGSYERTQFGHYRIVWCHNSDTDANVLSLRLYLFCMSVFASVTKIAKFTRQNGIGTEISLCQCIRFCFDKSFASVN